MAKKGNWLKPLPRSAPHRRPTSAPTRTAITQRAAIEGYAKRDGFNLVAEYNDAAQVFLALIRSRRRPRFADLLDRIEDHGVRTVIIEDAEPLRP